MATDRRENKLFEADDGSKYDLSGDDVVSLYSDHNLASIIPEFDREWVTSAQPCGSCESIAEWFKFMDRPTWESKTPHSSFVSIQDLSQASPDDPCLLCGFLGKLAQRLKSSGLAEGDQGYQLRATTSNLIFNGGRAASRRDDAPIFCVTPSGRDFIPDELMKHNAYFAPDSHRQGPEGVYARRIRPYWNPALVRQWINFCNEHHQSPKCHNLEKDVSIPFFSVIDCAVSPPCLVNADPRSPLEYITLSYVWGRDPCEGPDAFGRLPDELPDLIEGAMLVTLTLGYQYLWVDRYCIPQGDPFRKGKLIENMDKIYEDSALCIIATAAKSPSDGLHGITRPREVRQEAINLESTSLSQMMTNIKEEVGVSQWNSRGWTYQESMLARRRLVFTASQCCFQCGEQWFLETMDYPMRPSFNVSSIPHPFPTKFGQRHAFDGFEVCVQEFSRRQLSIDGDAIPAIAGVLKRFRSLTHISGVPVFGHSSVPRYGGLLDGLTWHFLINDSVAQSFPKEALPRRRLGVPSWTWCAWECGSTPYRPCWKYAGSSSVRLDFLTSTEIAVEDVQGNVAPWYGPTTDSITQNLSKLSEIKVLRVRGWVCEIAVPDNLQHPSPRNLRSGHAFMFEPHFEGDLPRLNALARKRQLRSVDGAFIFSGWVVQNLRREDGGDFEIWQVMLLSNAPKDQDVERLDMTSERRFGLQPSAETTELTSLLPNECKDHDGLENRLESFNMDGEMEIRWGDPVTSGETLTVGAYAAASDILVKNVVEMPLNNGVKKLTSHENKD